jgi:hypothetical protein
VAAVAIREGVNLHQPVMEAHRDLVARIGFVFDPRLGIVQQMAQSYGNLKEGNPDITFGGSELPGPAPYVAEHLPVQVFDEFLGQQIAAAVERPRLRAHDVLLFGFVQLTAIGDMRRNQIAHFLRRQRGGGIVRLFEQIAHG